MMARLLRSTKTGASNTLSRPLCRAFHPRTNDILSVSESHFCGQRDFRLTIFFGPQEREALPVEEDYPEHSKVFYLGPVPYGGPAQVIGHKDGTLAVRIAVSFPSIIGGTMFAVG
jgi:hypothetical protein